MSPPVTRCSSRRGRAERKATRTPPKSPNSDPSDAALSPATSSTSSSPPPRPPPPRKMPIPSSSSSTVAVASCREMRRINRLFNIFSDSKDVIDPEGIEHLCRALEIEHTDVKILMLAWKMNAKRQGFFSRNEWRVGLSKLRADSIRKLRSALLSLEIEARNPSYFRDFYSFSFRYNLTEEGQKSLGIDAACELMELVMGPLCDLYVQLFMEFLKEQTVYRALTMDQWICFHEFLSKINFPHLENYNPDDGWPAIFDSFVEWLEEC